MDSLNFVILKLISSSYLLDLSTAETFFETLKHFIVCISISLIGIKFSQFIQGTAYILEGAVFGGLSY